MSFACISWSKNGSDFIFGHFYLWYTFFFTYQILLVLKNKNRLKHDRIGG
jgi:hypothetical protein